MAHYGRICPFDTPQGSKIGLVNSLALRCKLEDGIPLAPYHPIIKKGGKYYISREIKYLSPKEEHKFKIGCILDLQHEDPTVPVFDSPIVETPIMARVPAVRSRTEEAMSVESIMLSELDYVSVYEDQLLSLNVALIPFVGSDDGPRLTFAASMLRQSVPILRSQKPRVYTNMYKDLVNKADYIVKAEEGGKVIDDLPEEYVRVQYNDGTEKTIGFTRSHNFGSSLIVMDTRLKKGGTFKKGDIIADSILSRNGMYSPGRNVLIAYMPWYGWNYDDSIVLSQKAACDFCSPIVNKLESVLPNNTFNNWEYREKIHNESYASAGTEILQITSRKISETKSIKAKLGKSGIVQSVYKTPSSEDDKLTITVKLLDIEELHQGDKMAGRHGNKGVVSRIEPSSTMPSFKNGEIIDVLQNPCGIGSRMNPGQLLEAQLGFVCYLLDLEIRSNSFNGAATSEIKDLVEFCWKICNTDDADPERILSQYDYPDIIKDAARNRFDYLQEWKDCFLPDGTAYLINNRTGELTESPVMIGCVYYLKLEHEVDHKRNERKGIIDSSYTQISKQPKSGGSVKGGQTVGEMEIWALASHGASEVLMECLNDKSDNVDIRKKMKEAISYGSGNYLYDVDYNTTSNTATEQFQYLLEAMGGYLEKSGVGTCLDKESILRLANQIKSSGVDLDFFDDIPDDFDD
jgi:DNA-directed RNA polymerase subunit beta